MSAVPLHTNRLTLIPHTPDDVRAQIARMTADERAHVSPEWLARVPLAAADDPWIRGFALVHRTTDVVIGTCGFKGPPDGDGIVEIAYGIAPDHQGHGYATEAAAALVAYAFKSGQVRLVRAHTLPEASASTRVLAKCGFRRVGEVIDPEDGLVWRWEQGLDWSGQSAGGSMQPTSVARTKDPDGHVLRFGSDPKGGGS